MDPATEQDEPADGEHSTEPLSDHDDAEGKANQPASGEESGSLESRVLRGAWTSVRQ